MSDNQPLPPEPETPSQSERSPREPNRLQSGFKTGTIKVLRGTIALLEGLVEQLEASPSSPTPVLPGVPGLGFILEKVRAALPEAVERRLPDSWLKGAIAAIVVVLVGSIAIALVPGKPAEVAVEPREPTEVVEVEPPQLPGPIKPPLQAPEAPDITKPEPELEKPELEEPELEEPLETAPELEPELAPELEPELAPELEPELTPEQILIAGIKSQVADVTRDYGDLILGIKANFSASVLQIQLSDRWYELLPANQDKIAAQMLEESGKLDFRKLEIISSQGSRIARSPVVGSQIIILQRSRP